MEGERGRGGHRERGERVSEREKVRERGGGERERGRERGGERKIKGRWFRSTTRTPHQSKIIKLIILATAKE